MHNYYIRDHYSNTLNYYLEKYNLPISYHWNDNDMTIFDKACFGEIPDITGH